MRQTSDVQQRAHQVALRAANEEVYRKLMQIDQLRLAHLDQSTNVLEAQHLADERRTAVHAAQELLASLQHSASEGNTFADASKAEAAAESLRTECAEQEAKLQEISQQLGESERMAAESAIETKRNEDRLAIAR